MRLIGGRRGRLAGAVAVAALLGSPLVAAPARADAHHGPEPRDRPSRLAARSVPAPVPTPVPSRLAARLISAPVPAVVPVPSPVPPRTPADAVDSRAVLPTGGTRILAGGRTLVAYYGTAGTGSLGVLGERGIAAATRRLRAAARPFARPGRPVQIVYELIVSVADGRPGADGDWSHDLPRSAVRPWIRAAHRHGALLVLDLQTGRQDFPAVARRWAWALRDPYVGLALDPEWRMGPGQVPGRVIGTVRAAEVDRTSRWLARLVRRHALPEKLFVLHQFRRSMVTGIDRVADRPGLVEIQHVDGYGTPGQKLATYHAVARPDRFAMGFKLFYDEDVHRMSPARVLQIRPRVRFVSFQ